MGPLSTFFASASLFLGVVSASGTVCSPTSKCPSSAPCCSAYGQCGTGAYCLGGCDPMSSFNLKSCMPRPTCQSEDYSLTSLDGMQLNTGYLGDPTDVNWVAEGRPAPYQDESVLLTLAPDTSGTLLASSHYVWYGKISATMRSSAGQGVVTAFIMMSDVKDEIDFEFVGNDLQQVQSNYYWQGVPDYTHARNITASNTNTEWHTYTIDWQEDELTWSVDDVPYRTLKKSSTYNSTTGVYNYPQTPARIMISVWPAGTKENGKGTIIWAGGLIDWNSQYMENGYYFAQIKEVKVECADPPSGTTTTGSNSYEYKDLTGLEKSVEITDANTILGSFYATGNNQDYHPSKSNGGSDAQPSNIQTVPGISGGGVRGSDGAPITSGSGGSSGGIGHGSQLPGSNPTFTQGLTNMAAGVVSATGSSLGVLVALLGALVLLS